MLAPRISDRRPFAAALAALVILAWVVLFAWDRSPYARFLDHDALADLEVGLSGEAALYGVAFVAGWTVMTFAMMLPTSLPLINLFQGMTARRPERGALLVLLVAGYLAVWTAFGAAAHAADLGIHEAVERSAWLSDNAWLIGAGTLALAGAYQFTPLKYMCLDKCRSPFAFISEHWHGSRPRSEAMLLGLRHGLFCLGCCWTLMLLMFAVGVGNLGWMLALGAVMAVEKNVPWGRRISVPLGVGLIAGAVALTITVAPGACAAHIGC